MAKKFREILEALPSFRTTAEEIRELVLTNLVLVGEIPAPTFGEGKRMEFLQNRFSECGLQNTSADESGNGLGILPGEEGKESILLVAHADTVFSEKDDHTISVQPHKVVGPGVADNSLGLAVLASLPALLEKLDLRFKSDLIFMAAVKSLGRGNLQGLRFFLDNNTLPIKAGVCVEGVELGRLSIGTIGMVRGEIRCTVPDEYDWTRFGASGAILTINEVINRIMAIELPRKPRTSIVLSSVEGGTAFEIVATRALLRFEIRSERADKARRVSQQVADIVADVSSQTESEVVLDIVARRNPGGIPFCHPLSRRTRQIMETLDIRHRKNPSTAELSSFIEKQIPAVTVGVATGEHLGEPGEMIRTDQIPTGLAQIVGMLAAIDGGFCNERR